MAKISNILNKEKIPTKKNKKWGSQTISTILKNPVYCGYLHWEEYLNPGDHNPIINKDVFNKVQKMIKSRNIKKNHTSKSYIIPD
jgi:site-specific DNA recombinase